MSQENVENVRRGIDAWNRGDLDAWLAGFAPEAEFHTTGRFADQGVYRGRAGLEQYWGEIREDVEDLSTSVSEIRTIGDKVFVAATGRGRGKRGKVPVEGPMWFVMTFRDGLNVRIETFVDRDEALEAAGLSEWAMSRENVELVQSVLEAWNRADYAAVLEHVAPEIKTESHLGDDLDGTYEGIAGLQKYLADYWSSFTDCHVEIDECIAGGTEVAFLAHLYGRGRASGVEVKRRNWQVVTVRGCKFVRYRLFRTKAEALEAVGLPPRFA